MIAVHSCRLIDIVDDYIEITIAVEVGHCQAVGHGGTVETPIACFVGKGNRTCILKYVIRCVDSWHLGNNLHRISRFTRALRFQLYVHGIIEKLHVGIVARVTIGNKNIFVGIQIKVGTEGCPRPVCIRNPRLLPNLCKEWQGNTLRILPGITCIELKHIAHRLVIKSIVDQCRIFLKIIIPRGHLDTLVGGGQHIEGHQVCPAIVVDICRIGAHREERYMPHSAAHLFTESTISLIEVEIILLVVIIGNVEIRPAIVVKITGSHPQTEAQYVGYKACFSSHIRKFPSLIAHEFGSIIRILGGFHLWQGRAEAGIRLHRMIEDKTVEIPVLIIIKKDCLGRIGRIIEAVSCSLFGKMSITIVDEEQIAAKTSAECCRATQVDI